MKMIMSELNDVRNTHIFSTQTSTTFLKFNPHVVFVWQTTKWFVCKKFVTKWKSTLVGFFVVDWRVVHFFTKTV